MKFDKEYFEGKHSNYTSYESMMDKMKNIYFPKITETIILNKKSKILDIGCAYGYFLKRCDDYGCETYGIDISTYAIDKAKSITNANLYIHDINNGFPMFQDDFFDIITMFDVIEHIESPYSILKNIRSILKINGRIIMTTPNLNAIDRLIKKNNWYGFKDKSHIHLFYPDSLKFLIECVGFRIEKIETPFHPLPKIVQKLTNKTNLGGQIWLIAIK